VTWQPREITLAKKAKRKTAKKVVAKRAKRPVKKAKRPARKKVSAKKTAKRASLAKKASPAKKGPPARAQRKPARKTKTRVPSPPAELLVSNAEPQFVTPLPMDDV
jgi:hypothetical protein